jgi:hypothetical protein
MDGWGEEQRRAAVAANIYWPERRCTRQKENDGVKRRCCARGSARVGRGLRREGTRGGGW